MTYGYDVISFFSNVSQSSIFQHAINLLEDLQRKRRSLEEKKRPIIFVGHNLGGLVIKDALSRSNEYNKAQGRNSRPASIVTSTSGIVFLGTPHRGGNHAAWAKIVTNLASLVLNDCNTRRGSEVLERLQDSFSGIGSRFSICSFFEDQAYGGGAGKIVDDDSATLGYPNERKQWIPANHSNMCKFEDEKDIGFERVAGALYELVEDASPIDQDSQMPSKTTGGWNIVQTSMESVSKIEWSGIRESSMAPALKGESSIVRSPSVDREGPLESQTVQSAFKHDIQSPLTVRSTIRELSLNNKDEGNKERHSVNKIPLAVRKSGM